MLFNKIKCPFCNSNHIKIHTLYTIISGKQRKEYKCVICEGYFSETKNSPLEYIKTPLSKIVQVIDAINEGMGINAVCRVFKVGKNSIYLWKERLSSVKETLLLYSLSHNFLQQIIEGDEIYTKVQKNLPPDESKGWTIVLTDRASRFIWQLDCGKKDRKLFKKAMRTLSDVIKQTDDLSLVTDGERRYGNLLFEICHETLRNQKPGRPKKTLPKGIKVRVKNKGSQGHKKGPKRPKYQAPQNEHPETKQNLNDKQIHANHVEAFNSSLRGKCSAFRRRTNTYAKKDKRLQQTLDVYWIIHNFVRQHFTTRIVPAVAIGILENGFSLEEIFRIQRI